MSYARSHSSIGVSSGTEVFRREGVPYFWLMSYRDIGIPAVGSEPDSLQLLAEHGLTAVRPDELGAARRSVRLEAESSDRPALWLLGRTLRAVEDAWSEQGVPGPLADALVLQIGNHTRGVCGPRRRRRVMAYKAQPIVLDEASSQGARGPGPGHDDAPAGREPGPDHPARRRWRGLPSDLPPGRDARVPRRHVAPALPGQGPRRPGRRPPAGPATDGESVCDQLVTSGPPRPPSTPPADSHYPQGQGRDLAEYGRAVKAGRRPPKDSLDGSGSFTRKMGIEARQGFLEPSRTRSHQIPYPRIARAPGTGERYRSLPTVRGASRQPDRYRHVSIASPADGLSAIVAGGFMLVGTVTSRALPPSGRPRARFSPTPPPARVGGTGGREEGHGGLPTASACRPGRCSSGDGS